MGDQSSTLSQGYILRGSQYTYNIRHVLGQGTFGITYLATMQTRVSGKMGGFEVTVKVAVKEFFMKELNGREGSTVTSSSQNGYFTDYKRKFLREAENLAKLQHPNIVKVLETFEANGTAYYAMEYLDGGSLESLIQKRGALSKEESLWYMYQIASALECMHAHNMLHLDLKPGNVMLRDTGEAVLIDFGLSKQFDENGEPESSTSLGGGTPGYAPIEQTNYQRGEGLPVTMDVYALGATLYKMLTGKRPPNADVILNEELPILPLQQRGISLYLIDVILRAMAPVKRSRYQNVDEFVQACRKEEYKEEMQETTLLEVDRGADAEQFPIPQPQPFSESRPSSQPKSPSSSSSVQRKPFIIAGVVALIGICLYFVFSDGNGHDNESDDISVAYEDTIHNNERTFTVNDVSFTMMRVEGGTFQMGATLEQDDPYEDEKPVHSVTLSSYYIGQTEVTQALWKAVMGSNPSNWKGDNLPVEQVSWNDCQEFVRKLNQLTGQNFRLPTEAEWEYAARGGRLSNGYKYSGSDNIDDVAWYDSNSGGKTHPVASKQPNELGLYDMSGNVCEWCQDRYDSYSPSSVTNPTGPASGSSRVYRSGTWDYTPKGCRVSYRNEHGPNNRFGGLGFRLALPE